MVLHTVPGLGLSHYQCLCDRHMWPGQPAYAVELVTCSTVHPATADGVLDASTTYLWAAAAVAVMLLSCYTNWAWCSSCSWSGCCYCGAFLMTSLLLQDKEGGGEGADESKFDEFMGSDAGEQQRTGKQRQKNQLLLSVLLAGIPVIRMLVAGVDDLVLSPPLPAWQNVGSHAGTA